MEEFEVRTGTTDHGLTPATKETVQLLVDPVWRARHIEKKPLKNILANLRKDKPEYEDTDPVADLDKAQLSLFSLPARRDLAAALRSKLVGGPLFNMVKALLDQFFPVDCIVLLAYTMGLGRTDDTFQDSEFIYQSIKWDSNLCAQPFFNLFDEWRWPPK